MNTFMTLGLSFGWIQIEFPEIVNGIKVVEVAKINIKNYRKFAGVELRIGTVNEAGQAEVQLSANPLVSYFDEAEEGERMAIFDLWKTPASGKFMTLQQIQGRLSMDELFIKV